MMNTPVAPGQIFMYRERPRFLRPLSGAGQVLGSEDDHAILFVRIFDVSGEGLKPAIGFLPLTVEAYEASHVEVVKRLPLPDGWESLRDEWRTKWREGEAGVFSQPLREVTHDTLKTVDYLRDGGVVELAFPKRSASGRFDTIEAVVRG